MKSIKIFWIIVVWILFFLVSGLHAETGLKSETAAKLDSIAMEFFTQGEFDNAIENYQSALKVDPKYTRSLWGLAASYVLKDETNKAIDMISNRLDNCTDPDMKINLKLELSGLMYIEKKNVQANKLLMDLKDNLDEVPEPLDQLRLLQTMGMIWREGGDMTHAELANQKRLDIVKTADIADSLKLPHHANALWDLAHFAIIRGDMTKAKECEIAMLNLDIENPEETLPYQKMQAVFALYGGRYDEAIEFFKTQKTNVGMKRLAFAYTQKGDTEMANQVISELASNYQRGILYLMIRNNMVNGLNPVL